MYNCYGIAFDSGSLWSFDNGTATNVIIFGVDSSSSSLDNRKNNFLILSVGPTFGINEKSGLSEKTFSINFTKPNTKLYLSFSSSLALQRTKYLFLNDEPCVVRPTLIDLNPVELKYFPFMISLNKCIGSCNVLSPKIYVSKETKDINVNEFNTITKMKLKQ